MVDRYGVVRLSAQSLGSNRKVNAAPLELDSPIPENWRHRNHIGYLAKPDGAGGFGKQPVHILELSEGADNDGGQSLVGLATAAEPLNCRSHWNAINSTNVLTQLF